jgi:hypothetical protein
MQARLQTARSAVLAPTLPPMAPAFDFEVPPGMELKAA